MKPNTNTSIFLLFLCLSAGTVFCQSDSTALDIAGKWRSRAESIVVLQDDNEILPIKNISGRRFHWLTYGLGEDNVFKDILAKYTVQAAERLAYDPLDLVIVGIGMRANQESDPEYRSFLSRVERQLSDSAMVVVVVFGDRDLLPALNFTGKANVLIHVPSDDDISQSLAAQLLFGGIGASGKLPESIGTLYRRGDGLETGGQIRLRYSPPELLGMDSDYLLDSIRQIVEEGIRGQAYPGAQVLIARNGHVIFHETYGYHTYDSIREVQATDLYDFASVTKVTSTLPALMRLYGEGEFDLDAPLRQYLPFFRRSDKADVTFREFLAHYGGLKPGIVFWRQAKRKNGRWKCRSFRDHYSRRFPIRITDSLYLFRKYRKKILKGIRDLPLNEERQYVYSDLSFILYPEIVENLTGEPLESYLKETFYHPIGAYTLTYNPVFSRDRIIPTERDTFFRKIQVHGSVHDETAAMLGGISGHAGLFGTANDLAKLVQMYLNKGEYGGQRLIPAAAVNEFTRCQYCDEGNRRGLGFDKPLIEYDPEASYVAKDASPDSFGHSGYTGTFFWADPVYDLQVIFFSNRVYPDRSHRALYELDIRPRIHQVVYDAIHKSEGE